MNIISASFYALCNRDAYLKTKKGLGEVIIPQIEVNNEDDGTGTVQLRGGASFDNNPEVPLCFVHKEEIKQGTGKDKVLVVQPFGRTTETHGDFIVDPTSRSFQLNNIVDVINILKTITLIQVTIIITKILEQ